MTYVDPRSFMSLERRMADDALACLTRDEAMIWEVRTRAEPMTYAEAERTFNVKRAGRLHGRAQEKFIRLLHAVAQELGVDLHERCYE